jgi:hypothetical protein
VKMASPRPGDAASMRPRPTSFVESFTSTAIHFAEENCQAA